MPSFSNRYSNPKFGKLSHKHPLQSDHGQQERTSRCASFKICTMQPSLGGYSLGIPMTQGINTAMETGSLVDRVVSECCYCASYYMPMCQHGSLRN